MSEERDLLRKWIELIVDEKAVNDEWVSVTNLDEWWRSVEKLEADTRGLLGAKERSGA